MKIKKLIDKINGLKPYPASPFFIKQKFMSIFTLLIMCTCLGIGISCGSDEETPKVIVPEPDPDPDPEPGSSEDNPIEIGTYAEFLKIRDNMSAHYKLTSDIDMVASCTKTDESPGVAADVTNGDCKTDAGFRPFGSKCEGDDMRVRCPRAFVGTLNGGGFKIMNLYIHQADGNQENNDERDELRVGLFNSLRNGSHIRNLVLENIHITGDEDTGGLTGHIFGGCSVENVRITKAKIIGGSKTGGLTGAMGHGNRDHGFVVEGSTKPRERLLDNSSIKNVSVEDDVEITFSGNTAGGLIGIIWGVSTIEKSYSKATLKRASGVSTSDAIRVGGLVGQMRNYARISQSYAEATIGETSSTIKMAGGLVGEILGGSPGAFDEPPDLSEDPENEGHGPCIIEDSYAAGTIHGDEDVGGLVGRLGGKAKDTTAGEEKETNRTQITNVYSNTMLTGTLSDNPDWAGLVGNNGSSLHSEDPKDRALDALRFMGNSYYLFPGTVAKKNDDGFGQRRNTKKRKLRSDDICDGNAGDATATPPIPPRGECEVKTVAELQMLDATMTEWDAAIWDFGDTTTLPALQDVGYKAP